MFCIYFYNEDDEKLAIEATRVKVNEKEVIYEDKRGNIIAFFDRNMVKGTVKVDGNVKVI